MDAIALASSLEKPLREGPDGGAFNDGAKLPSGFSERCAAYLSGEGFWYFQRHLLLRWQISRIRFNQTSVVF